ncbi:hypothetical protein BP6252_03470 [Coleophoma cylindrospora]|uniref:Glucose receptor Git3-like N-terminal domain-containing protein n=1 Tax=Coleophoma cylindrospora TaxID=1849047 RepID=A0A3D8S991_9HELO|nr:hypothetical protein BP6252_03470 [Coleophoma cylindrospora]
MLDLAVAIPTLVGSIVSMLASGTMLLCYCVLPPQRHFRHTLIINLATADFLNSTNNTVSGIYVMIRRSISPGAACSFNGWLGQISVQATDFAILFISIATVITLRRTDSKPDIHRKGKILMTCGIWLVPFATSGTGLLLGDYKPVSGNWCWLDSTKPYLRYALGHGWRITIMIMTVSLYAYLFIYMHKHFSTQRKIAAFNEYPRQNISEEDADATFQERNKVIYVYDEFEFYEEQGEDSWDPKTNRETPRWNDEYIARYPREDPLFSPTHLPAEKAPTTPPLSPYKIIKQTLSPYGSEDEIHSSRDSAAISISTKRKPTERSPLVEILTTRDPLALVRRPKNIITTQVSTKSPVPKPLTRESIRERELRIQKLLLFNAYPIAYILLLFPGILNRFLELTGHKSRAVTIAQASTQFVGLANALVYGYNERIWTLAGQWWNKKPDGQDGRRGSKAGLLMRNSKRTDSWNPEISWPLH